VLRGWQGADEVQADEVQADEVQVGEARGRALPGVEDHRQVFVVGGQCPVAGDELVDDRGDTATSGAVTG